MSATLSRSNYTDSNAIESLLELDSLDLQSYNRRMQYMHPSKIVEWVADNADNPIITTNFRPQTAAILHLVTQVIPDINVLWVDSGYNTEPTLAYAERLSNLLNLNLTVYRPEPSEQLDYFKKQGIPLIDDPRHDEFTKVVKLDPFAKGLEELKPDAWITGIRHEQTEFRKSLDILSYANSGVLKVAPIFYWSKQQQLAYIAKHNLPDEPRYFDPTKASDHRECGIQLL